MIVTTILLIRRPIMAFALSTLGMRNLKQSNMQKRMMLLSVKIGKKFITLFKEDI
jgi:hypothetical protein